jgi:ABC-2 type transport system ATP-binding protein
MDAAAISLRGLTKHYGPHRGITDLSLDVARGSVFGFLGPNGAGKTTTIRMLLDLIRPTSGTVTVLGSDVHAGGVALRARMGYLPGDLALYERLTGAGVLRFFGVVRGCAPTAGHDLAQRLDLDLQRRVSELSTGNRQKLGLVQALMHRPDVAVLDEPTTGLDPGARQEVHVVLRELADGGRTVFLSSHVLHEVEQVADRVAIVADGRLVVTDGVEELKARAAHRYELEFARPPMPAALADVPGVGGIELRGRSVSCTVQGPVGPLMRAALAWDLVAVTRHDPDLEQIFLDYVGSTTDER